MVFTALLAVGLAEESKAPVVVANPYLYGYPGYGYYGHGAPLAYGAAYAPHHVAAAPVPVTQTYAPAYALPAAPVVAPVPAPALSSQFAAQVSKFWVNSGKFGKIRVNSLSDFNESKLMESWLVFFVVVFMRDEYTDVKVNCIKIGNFKKYLVTPFKKRYPVPFQVFYKTIKCLCNIDGHINTFW